MYAEMRSSPASAWRSSTRSGVRSWSAACAMRVASPRSLAKTAVRASMIAASARLVGSSWLR